MQASTCHAEKRKAISKGKEKKVAILAEDGGWLE
jgi:hypothetical protein